ncbi:hypothetical protein FOCC_FOCC012544 [Frankliniella occidentalis]|nr:hypothetical protein FOCC_FOCC012544 [Frankliniella occidentalis]
MMDAKTRSKIIKTHDSADAKTATIEDTQGTYSDMCSSSDFPSSQECFSVGWDWSGQKSNKPSIRVIERPVHKRTKAVELIQCVKNRQFVRECDPEMFDASNFVDKLKSLAAGFKCVPESTSPVASPPPSNRRQDLLVTPTALRKPTASSKSESSSNSTTTFATTSSLSFEGVKENLNDLLDDSLGADLLKCTQDLEQDYNQKELKTPSLPEVRLSSSKRKHRLSLSSKKNSKTVCRRINDVYEKQPVENQKTVLVHTEKSQDRQNNNKGGSSKNEIIFDDFDDAALLTLGELEEKVVKSKSMMPDKESIYNADISNSKNIPGSCNALEDDEFISPEILNMLDACEKKATQEKPGPSNSSFPAASEANRHQPSMSKKQVVPPCKSSSSKFLLHSKEHEKSCSKVRAEANSHHPSKREVAPLSAEGDHQGSSSKNLLDWIEEEHEKSMHKMRGEATNHQPPKKSLSRADAVLKCTPEEIEKKRQEARKRLQLKKRPR